MTTVNSISISRLMQQGIQHHMAGQLAEAEAIYRRVLDREPNHPDAWNLLGVAAGQRGRADLAVEFIGRAIALCPAVAVYHDSLGESYRRMGRPAQAIEHFRRAVELDPSLVETLNKIGSAEGIRADRRSMATFASTIRLRPDFPDSYTQLGDLLRARGRFPEAIAAFSEACAASTGSCIGAQ